ALKPEGADGVGDELGFDGALGVELVLVVAGKGVELGGVFTGKHEGLGVEAEFEGIGGGDGLPLGGAGAGGELRVGKSSGLLGGGGHTWTPFKEQKKMQAGRPALREQ